ncbi:MAG: hypothetical protein K2X39_07350 [Silvanigrellaceae bacterium]|nr:hypothetical protein [Silvanigrellaceae bacterium]
MSSPVSYAQARSDNVSYYCVVQVRSIKNFAQRTFLPTFSKKYLQEKPVQLNLNIEHGRYTFQMAIANEASGPIILTKIFYNSFHQRQEETWFREFRESYSRVMNEDFGYQLEHKINENKVDNIALSCVINK